ncbi:PH domain-containing protein [Entamoeba marina]
MATDSELNISVEQLKPALYEGWGKKQGGSIKTWKKRWFVLKETRVWYFASKTETSAKGYIELPSGTEIRDLTKNKKFMFSINSRGPKGSRVFYIATENSVDHNTFFDAVKKVLTKSTGAAAKPTTTTIQEPVNNSVTLGNNPQPTSPRQQPQPSNPIATKLDTFTQQVSNGRRNITKVKSKISWLQAEGENVVEFWKYWMDSTPASDSLEPGQSIHFMLVVSGNTEKLSWRVFGPQGALIQNMVDFFWNVGAPDEEIDHLNNLGCQINPSEIGSWIDMSVMNGMDGGWFFKGDLVCDVIRDTADKCDHAERLIAWAKENGLNYLCQMGRDMGATPPRQSEFRFKLDGIISSRMDKVHSAFVAFGFPPIPVNIVDILNNLPPVYTFFYLCVIVSSEGFVKISVLVPSPKQDVVDSFLASMSDVKDSHIALHNEVMSILGTTPLFVEYTFLNQGYGYEVYKEGGDVLVHYDMGSESR